MTEAVIKKAVYKQLKDEGFIGWSAPKVKFQETDIFGIFDGMFIKDSDLRFIQWTTDANMKAREKKILKFFEENNCFIPCEVWGMKKDKTFKIMYI
jgi:hypothetical protein